MPSPLASARQSLDCSHSKLSKTMASGRRGHRRVVVGGDHPELAGVAEFRPDVDGVGAYEVDDE